MNISKLTQLTRSLLDEYGTVWLKDSDTTRYSILDGLQDAYIDYSYQTKCFRSSFTNAASANVSEYTYTSISTGAAKVFEVTAVAFDSVMLTPVMETQLSGNWRFDSSDTPTNYIAWGDRGIKLYPTPIASGTVYFEGYVGADISSFSASGDSPDIPDVDHKLLAIKAAMEVIVRNPSEFNSAKYEPLSLQYKEGIEAAIRRARSDTSAVDVVIGSRQQTVLSDSTSI